MNIPESIQLISMLAMFAVLVNASMSDIRKREISDINWIVLGAAGLGMYLFRCIALSGLRWEFFVCAMCGVLTMAVFLRDNGRYEAVIGIIAIAGASVLLYHSDDVMVRSGAVAVLMSFLYLVMYWFGIIRGGADVKCLVCVGLTLPAYPAIPTLLSYNVPASMELLFSPSLSALMIASVLAVSACSMYCLTINILSGRRPKGFLHCYYLDVDRAEKSFVWPVQDIEDGKVCTCQIPEESELCELYGRFRKAGVEKVLVTPMIPFIVPITVAVAILVVLGNPLFIL